MTKLANPTTTSMTAGRRSPKPRPEIARLGIEGGTLRDIGNDCSPDFLREKAIRRLWHEILGCRYGANWIESAFRHAGCFSGDPDPCSKARTFCPFCNDTNLCNLATKP